MQFSEKDQLLVQLSEKEEAIVQGGSKIIISTLGIRLGLFVGSQIIQHLRRR